MRMSRKIVIFNLMAGLSLTDRSLSNCSLSELKIEFDHRRII